MLWVPLSSGKGNLVSAAERSLALCLTLKEVQFFNGAPLLFCYLRNCILNAGVIGPKACIQAYCQRQNEQALICTFHSYVLGVEEGRCRELSEEIPCSDTQELQVVCALPS